MGGKDATFTHLENEIGDAAEVLRGIAYSLSLLWDELQSPDNMNIGATRCLIKAAENSLQTCATKLDGAYDLVDEVRTE